MARLVCAVVGLLLAVSPAAADVCEDLWFTRNLIMDRNGYCFGSTLGKAMFDNRDCLGKQISLSGEEQFRVAEIQKMERWLNCRVNTARAGIDIVDEYWLRRMEALPIRQDGESACLGWQGPPVPLFPGFGPGLSQIGGIVAGDSILWSHQTEPGTEWTYVTVWSANWERLKSAGWVNFAPVRRGGWLTADGQLPCEGFAG